VTRCIEPFSLPAMTTSTHEERLSRALHSLDGLSVGDAWGECFFGPVEVREPLRFETAELQQSTQGWRRWWLRWEQVLWKLSTPQRRGRKP
jgi:hypothetical protein